MIFKYRIEIITWLGLGGEGGDPGCDTLTSIGGLGKTKPCGSGSKLRKRREYKVYALRRVRVAGVKRLRQGLCLDGGSLTANFPG